MRKIYKVLHIEPDVEVCIFGSDFVFKFIQDVKDLHDVVYRHVIQKDVYLRIEERVYYFIEKSVLLLLLMNPIYK